MNIGTIKLILSAFYFLAAQVVYGQSAIQVAGTATKTATTSGNWSSASTWGGTPPVDDDRVLIPSGIIVTVDGMIAQEFKSVNIADGGKP